MRATCAHREALTATPRYLSTKECELGEELITAFRTHDAERLAKAESMDMGKVLESSAMDDLKRQVRNLQYHAEMAEDAIRSELHRLQNVRVLGGGRLAFDGRTVSIWGYSKTYGRCEACNERAAALIRSSPAHAQYRVTWTNDGY